jgi:hypothetical protein
MSEELKKEFEANFLDGDSTEDCGGATFTASGVLDVLDFFLAKQQEEFVTKIKGMLMDDSNHNDYYYGYNDALNDLLEDFADIKSKLLSSSESEINKRNE